MLVQDRELRFSPLERGDEDASNHVLQNLSVCTNARWGNIFELGKIIAYEIFCMENYGEELF